MTLMRMVIVGTAAITATKIATKFGIAKDFFEVTKRGFAVSGDKSTARTQNAGKHLVASVYR